MATIMIDNRQNLYNTEEIEKLIEKTIKKAAECENVKQDYQVSVILVDNSQIKGINRVYRGIDAPTDVLSFPMLENEEEENLIEVNKADIQKDFENFDMDTGEIVLGDIAISLERAFEQSVEYGHAFHREVSFLTVHGMLHLLGFDHEEEGDRKVMREREEQILDLMSLKR